MAEFRLTYRQLDYWTRRGFLRPRNPAPGQGHARDWGPQEMKVAETISRLRLAGLELETAARVARAVRSYRVSEVTLAPGIRLVVDPPIDVPLKPKRGDDDE